MTAQEIRKTILEAVAANGGHLASSLGVVELTMALVDVFDPWKDRIVWDVGHQAYAWKILTGRAGDFSTLRRFGGISGFPNPSESAADAAVAGHAGVALSVAEGLASARDLKHTGEHVVAVIGDASFSNGTTFEALNNCASSCSKVIVILNDNEMSISKPTGALSRLLGRLIATSRYNRFKSATKKACRSFRMGFLIAAIRSVKRFFKRMFIGLDYFEQFGLRYIGPVDGHDLAALKVALEVAKAEDRSVILHVVTRKGCGFVPAETNPTRWHGTGPFNLAAWTTANAPQEDERASAGKDWSQVFGETIVDFAARDDRIVALTAAMKDGTGLDVFAERFPDRFYDVGISEGHLVAFAAGLAGGGMRPVVAVYSTFLQRAIDQVMHDVCIASLPVVFCIDRAGVVGADGMTHQGVFDLAMLRSLPNLTICQPVDEEDFRKLFAEAVKRQGPTAIRYPRGRAFERLPAPVAQPAAPKFAIWCTGDWYAKAAAAAARLGGIAVHARYLKPFDRELLARQRAAGMAIVSLENGCVQGGLGEAIGADLRLGWPDEFIPHGSQAELERCYGLDLESVVAAIAASDIIGKGKAHG